MTKNYWALALIIVVGIIIFLLGVGAVINDDTNPVPEIGQGLSSTQINGQQIPYPVDYVTDNAEIVNDKVELSLNTKLREFAQTDKGEVAVLTVKTLGGLSVEEFAIRVAEKWAVGDKSLDNGVIIVIATDERKVRIEVGRGASITDAQAGRILDEVMIPKLKRSDWGGAIEDGVNAIIDLMNK